MEREAGKNSLPQKDDEQTKFGPRTRFVSFDKIVLRNKKLTDATPLIRSLSKDKVSLQTSFANWYSRFHVTQIDLSASKESVVQKSDVKKKSPGSQWNCDKRKKGKTRKKQERKRKEKPSVNRSSSRVRNRLQTPSTSEIAVEAKQTT